MGGQNHQPCNTYLKNSTRLSCSLSRAHAELQLANIDLEEVILQEFDLVSGSMQGIVSHLSLSLASLAEAKKSVCDLRTQMVVSDYKDLPTLHKLDLLTIGSKLAEIGCIDLESWDKILKVFKGTGFYGVLELFENSIDKLLLLTHALSNGIRQLEQDAENMTVSKVLEENRSGNIKVEFAALYTHWANFNHEFLASSLISTEVWYAFCGYGSLTGNRAMLKAV